MKEPTELDEAALRFQFRTMYKEIGYFQSLQVLYELLISAQILSEVIIEEKADEFNGLA